MWSEERQKRLETVVWEKENVVPASNRSERSLLQKSVEK